MNKDIKIMIELQRFWDVILSQKAEIERAQKNIVYWQTEDLEKQTKTKQAEDYNKALALKIKENETTLAALDLKINKIEEKRLSLKSEKELTSLENELQTVKDEKSALEDKLIEYIDKQEDVENKTKKWQKVAFESTEQVQKDIHSIKDKIKSHEDEIAHYEKKFDELFESLSTVYKSRFKKLLSSKEGRGIARLEGITCGSCRFSIPEHLALEASDGKSIINCSNCGRFIYGDI